VCGASRTSCYIGAQDILVKRWDAAWLQVTAAQSLSCHLRTPGFCSVASLHSVAQAKEKPIIRDGAWERLGAGGDGPCFVQALASLVGAVSSPWMPSITQTWMVNADWLLPTVSTLLEAERGGNRSSDIEHRTASPFACSPIGRRICWRRHRSPLKLISRNSVVA
jgi:hypothetical protein